MSYDAAHHPALAAYRVLREWREEHNQLRQILKDRPHTKPEADRARELDRLLPDEEQIYT